MAMAVSATSVAQAETPKPVADVRITGGPATGVVVLAKPVTWTIERPAGVPADGLTYRLRDNNFTTIQEGVLPADEPTLAVTTAADKPGWLILDVSRKADGKSIFVTSAGVVAAPDRILPTSPKPDDFDAFWKAQLAALAKVPPNAKETPLESPKPGVTVSEITLDNVDDAHVRAQLGRPEKGEKFPAVVVYQWAGVYPLSKGNVVGYADQGFLVLNVMAHDLPLYEPKDFYDAQNNGPLKNYVAIGNTSRETSYFRKMFLGDYQALEYLTSRPDWDGRTLVVRGDSQGGMQAFAMAGLHPKVTAMIAVVPAGCDPVSVRAGRASGWPYWSGMQPADRREAILDTARYYDPAHFAQAARCPALVTAGLRDVTSPPANVIAAFNSLAGPKELVLMPDATHQQNHQPSHAAVGRWFEAIRAGRSPTSAGE